MQHLQKTREEGILKSPISWGFNFQVSTVGRRSRQHRDRRPSLCHGLSTFSSLSIESKRSHMTGQPPSDRFKTEMPQIPGVSGSRSSAASNPAVKLVIGLLTVLLVVFLGARFALRPKHAAPPPAEQQPQIEVPSPAPDP